MMGFVDHEQLASAKVNKAGDAYWCKLASKCDVMVRNNNCIAAGVDRTHWEYLGANIGDNRVGLEGQVCLCVG